MFHEIVSMEKLKNMAWNGNRFTDHVEISFKKSV